jgi:hypothetical protein
VARLVRKRHQSKHLDFDLVLLRTRRSGVRVPAHHSSLIPFDLRGNCQRFCVHLRANWFSRGRSFPKIVSQRHGPALLPEDSLGLHFYRFDGCV